MDNRLVTFKPIGDSLASVCCLRSIKKSHRLYPGEAITCNRCGTFLRCCWLDFNEKVDYGVRGSLKSRPEVPENYVPLTAIVVRDIGDSPRELEKKFIALYDNVSEDSLSKCEVMDSDVGREFVFNKGIEVEETRILMFDQSVFVIIAKVSDETLSKLVDINGIVFKSDIVNFSRK